MGPDSEYRCQPLPSLFDLIMMILPQMDALSIFPATKEQILESRHQTWTEWSRGLSLEAYLQREEMLNSQPHANNGKLTIWCVCPKSLFSSG